MCACPTLRKAKLSVTSNNSNSQVFISILVCQSVAETFARRSLGEAFRVGVYSATIKAQHFYLLIRNCKISAKDTRKEKVLLQDDDIVVVVQQNFRNNI